MEILRKFAAEYYVSSFTLYYQDKAYMYLAADGN